MLILLDVLIKNIWELAVLDSNLNLSTHIDEKMKKCNKMIGLIRRLSVNLPRNSIFTIYFVIYIIFYNIYYLQYIHLYITSYVYIYIYILYMRPHLVYGDILYDKPNNESFQKKMEKVQYRACLAITGEIKGTSREQLYEELGLH